MIPPVFPPSGRILYMFSLELNTAPREFLLQVIEWCMVGKSQPLKDNTLLEDELLQALYKRALELQQQQRDSATPAE